MILPELCWRPAASMGGCRAGRSRAHRSHPHPRGSVAGSAVCLSFQGCITLGAKGVLSSSAQGFMVQYTPCPGQAALQRSPRSSPHHLEMFPSAQGRRDFPHHSQLQRPSHLLSLLLGFWGGICSPEPPASHSVLPLRVHTNVEFWHQKGHQLCLLLSRIQHQGPP